MTSSRSAGSSKDSVMPERTAAPRSSLLALSRMRSKKRSVDSTTIRTLPPRLAILFVEVPADLGRETPFGALI